MMMHPARYPSFLYMRETKGKETLVSRYELGFKSRTMQELAQFKIYICRR